MKKVVIVTPTFNEEANIESFLKAVLDQKKNLTGHELSIVVSDSHSTDGTPKIVKSKQFQLQGVYYLDVKKRGLGLGLVKGIDYAVNNGADILVTMEADLSNDPKQIPEFVRNIDGVDVIVGSRYIFGGKIVNWSWWRRALSRIANLILMLLAGTTKIHEFTNLYRAFTKEAWQKIEKNTSVHVGWLFVPAFVFESLDENLRIAEIPIVYFDRFGGQSKMKTLSYTTELLRYALRYRLRKSASVVKFAVVGGWGFIINTIVLVVGVNLGLRPSIAGPLGAELAIIFGFLANNFWTFSEDRITVWWQFFPKFFQYNVIAFGSVVIQFAFLRSGEWFFGLDRFKGPIIDLPLIRLYSWYLLFYMAGVGVGMVWNYIMYRNVVWRKKDEKPSQKS